MDSQKIFCAFFDRLSVMQPLKNGVHYTFHTSNIQQTGLVSFIFGVFVLGVILIFHQKMGAGITFCLCALALIPLFIYVINFAKKKVSVPDDLKNYMASFSPEQFFAAREKEKAYPPEVQSNIELIYPMEYQQENRYGIIRQHASKGVYILSVVFLLVFAAFALFERDYGFFLIVGAITGGFAAGFAWLYNFANTGEITVFDFQEKKIFYGRCRRFRPEKIGKLKSASFPEVDHLCLSSYKIEQPAGKNGTVMVQCLGLVAVKSDGDAIPLCRATKYNLPRLLALLPDLAEKLGHLPITFPGDLHL